MTGALVSGQDDVAVFQDGSRLWCVRPQSHAPQPVSHGLLPYLFVSIADASYHPEATLASTGQLLERAWSEERALHLALISMDPASSETTRELAEEALEEFLGDNQISEFIENRLFSDRLPESARWLGNVASAYPKVTLLKLSVLDAQESIGRVRAAWDALPEELFAEPDDRARFELVLVETGAFRTLAIAASDTAEQFSKGEAQLRLLSDPRHQTVTNYRNILVQWTETIPISPRVSLPPIREERDYEKPERWREELPKTATHVPTQKVKLFLSYAHHDERWRQELQKYLTPLRHSDFIIEVWHDRCIEPGTAWDEGVDLHLSTADIVLLLISPDFLASEFCYSRGMQVALGRHARHEAIVIPIILRPVVWQDTPLGRLLALPRGGRPVSAWRQPEKALLDVAREVQLAVEEMVQRRRPRLSQIDRSA